MLTQVKRFQDDLHKQGIRTGDIVGIQGAGSLDTIALLMASWSLGATTWLCQAREPAARIEEMGKRIGAKMVRCSGGHFHCMTGTSKLTRNDVEFHPEAKTLINTSGSTGQPKFVEHRLEQHFESAAGVNTHMEYDETGCWLLSLPLYHVGGLAIVIRALAAGGTIYLPAEGETVAQTILEQNITHLSLVSTQLKRLLSDAKTTAQLTKCKRVVLGGGPVSNWLSDVASITSLPLVSSYGATEMGSMWTATQVGSAQVQGSGKCLASRQIKIGDDGEVCVRGPMLFSKYLGDENKTGAAFDDDGFYRSGDLGHLDDQGNLHILGRRDNMFISGGENIHPQEIERALTDHALIDEAIVVSVPDPKWGERPVAFVRWNLDARLSEGELRNHLKRSLPSYKIPDRFHDWPLENEARLKPSRITIRQMALALM